MKSCLLNLSSIFVILNIKRHERECQPVGALCDKNKFVLVYLISLVFVAHNGPIFSRKYNVELMRLWLARSRYTWLSGLARPRVRDPGVLGDGWAYVMDMTSLSPGTYLSRSHGANP